MFKLGLITAWESPELIALNKLPPRATFSHFPTARQAMTRDPANSPWLVPLNGEWQFRHEARPEDALRTLETFAAAPVAWSRIQVPGNLQTQGYDKPHYTNIKMPFPEEPPRVPTTNPTGIYRRLFTVPAEWAGQRIVIHFGGATSVLSVYVNGVAVGLSKDSCLPAEFDISSVARPGLENEVVALVIKWSDATFIEDQDQWWLSGIHREVFLYATPRTYIADVSARPSLDADNRSGIFALDVRVGYDAELHKDAVIEVQLFDPKGRPVFKRPLSSAVSSKRATWNGTRFHARFREKIPPSRLQAWTHETPALYLALITLRSPGSTEHTSVRLGFRRVEIVGRDLLVNGRRVLIKGVNHHDHHPDFGKAVPFETMVKDVTLMKRFNFNAVRTSHYPNDPRWLDLCDEHGLYVFDEANLEAHDFHYLLCRDARYTAPWVDRVIRMVTRDQNHPSVIVWSLGNESGHGPNHDAAAGWVRAFDPGRPLHYEGAIAKQSKVCWEHGGAVTDLICPMYPTIAELSDWSDLVTKHWRPATAPWLGEAAKSALRAQQLRYRVTPDNCVEGAEPRAPLHPLARPVILCEYSCAMGNSNGSLCDYFELFRTKPGLQGGFIWEWLDHGIRQKSADGREFFAYGGDFGDTPHDANFVCDGLVSADRVPHPAIHEFKHLARPVRVEAVKGRPGRVRVRNEHDFVSLRHLRGAWELLVDGVAVRRGTLPRLDLAPGSARELSLPLARWAAGAEAHLTIRWRTAAPSSHADRGHEVACDQLALTPPPRPPRRTKSPARVTARETPSGIELSVGGLSACFDRSSAALASLRVGGIELLARGPLLELNRGATDNDGLKLWTGQGRKALGRWQKLGLIERPLSHRPDRFEWKTNRDGTATVILSHAASGRERWDDCAHVHRYTLHGDGRLQVDNEVLLSGDDMVDLPRIGVRLDLVPGYERLAYFGRGPFDNYSDRKTAALVARHETTVAATYVDYVIPQEHAHRTDVRWLELSAGRDAPVLRVDGGPLLEFNATHYAAEDLFAARHTTDLTPRAETILYLDAAHRGLGTASCGPDTLEPYRLEKRRYAFRYLLSSRLA